LKQRALSVLLMNRCLFTLAAAAALVQAQTAPPAYRVETVAGSALLGDGGPATAAQIGNIQGIAVDRLGNIYLSDTDHHQIRKIAPNGTIATIAGTGTAGFSGDGGPALAAQLNTPYGVAVDLAGYVYIADLGNGRVRRVSPDGAIATFAGGGSSAGVGDGGPATQAPLLAPRNIAIDAAGNVYVSEFNAHRVRKVSPDGTIATVAGTGVAGFRGDGASAALAQLAFPAGLALDRAGALYIADSQNQRIRKVVNGIITTALGGATATALLTPVAVAVDLSGDLFVADASAIIHEFSAAGAWSTAAGTGAQGFTGDGGAASSAQLTAPHDLAADLSGNLDIADGVRIRQVNSSGRIQTIAGDAYQHSVGDGGQATSAQLYQPSAVSLDSAGNLFIADTGTERVRQVKPSGIISTLAGTGVAGFNNDNIPAANAELYSPFGVAVDQSGSVLIADSYNHRIRKVTGLTITTFAGTGTSGTGPEGLPPAQTQLRGPRGVCGDRFGNVFIVDTSNHRVLRVPGVGNVSDAAGNGAPGNAGDGGAARLAQLNQPGACAVDVMGNLFIADTFNHEIRKVLADGTIATVAGTGQPGSAGDEGPATAAALNAPRGVALDGSGGIYIADTANNRIRMVTPDGIIHTIAGQNAAGFAGDGGAALSALLNQPQGLYMDGAGDLYLADTNNNRVRRLVPTVSQPVQVLPVATPPLSVVNAASLATGPVAPGELVTVFGTAIGPASGVNGTFDQTGLLANLLGGSEVHFDGVPAPVSYAQAAQINVQVPYTVAAPLTHVEVFYQGQSMGTADLAVNAAMPALFGPVVNQDGSLNSQSNPAPRSTVVTIYGTGEGFTTGTNVAGQPCAAPYAQPRLPVNLSVAGVTAQLLYAGCAPGMVGILQIDAVVPGGFVPSGPAAVQLIVGSAVSPILTMWVQ